MSKEKIIILICFIFQSAINSIYSKSKSGSTLYIYKGDDIIGKQLNYNVQFYNTNICTIKKNTPLQYNFLNEGKLEITVRSLMKNIEKTISLTIEHGKNYYLKIDCSLMGIELTTNQINGKNEWDNVSKTNLLLFNEDPFNPFLKKELNSENEHELRTAGTDNSDELDGPGTSEKKYMYNPYADIDFDIPTSQKTDNLAFALIIGNEDYSTYQTGLNSEVNVNFAKNDAITFKEYAIKVMGIPEKNITLILDGTLAQINNALSKINLIAKNSGGKAQIVFYYAGHGMPDEVTKTPYLIPVDVSGSNVSAGIKLKDVYSKLTEFSSERALVFLDACFTGGARGESIISARGVSIKPKDEFLKGNIAVFSSSSGKQSSLSYKDKRHGLYTYFLLKKFKETKGDVSLKDLSNYLKEKVSLESIIVNNKEQNPQTNVSLELSDKWEKIKLIR